ncbi:MAG: transporter substrate-binding domain-containing protein [Pseudomonadota bacterium]
MVRRPLAVPLFLALMAFSAASHGQAPQEAKPAAAKLPLRFIQKAEVAVSNQSTYSVSAFQTALGKALADQMGRPVVYVGLPRKRLIAGLEAGEGDLVCGYVPDWLAGQFDWSHPFIPVADLVITSPRVPELHSVAELKGKRVGTVLGFRYPELEEQLGADFKRDDGPSNDVSLHKLLAGRYDYLVTTRSLVDNYTAKGELPPGIHVLVVKEFHTMCAVSRHGNVGVDEVNAAIDAIVRNGTLTVLLRVR